MAGSSPAMTVLMYILCLNLSTRLPHDCGDFLVAGSRSVLRWKAAVKPYSRVLAFDVYGHSAVAPGMPLLDGRGPTKYRVSGVRRDAGTETKGGSIWQQ